MLKAPKIGDRVRYHSTLFDRESCTGIVTKIHPRHDDVFDDEGEFIRRGPLSPETEWKATVKVDERPQWWPYPDNDRFCPDVKDLELI